MEHWFEYGVKFSDTLEEISLRSIFIMTKDEIVIAKTSVASHIKQTLLLFRK